MSMVHLIFVICVGFLSRVVHPHPVKYPSEDTIKKAPKIAKTFGDIVTINADTPDLFEGDIILSHTRNAIADASARWETTVPFVLSGEYSHEKKSLIVDALYELEARTCFTFVERTTEVDYLSYEVQSGCYSHVGKNGGKQTISIGSGCENHRTVIHETLHALGFWHEQSRTDRDDYVTIVWDVIKEGKEHNFDKYENDQLDTQGVPYDYDSIMHYDDTAFSKNGSKTIIAPAEKTATMGKMDAMSKIDVDELNKLYSCQVNIDASGYTQWSKWGLCDKNCNRQRRRFCDGDQCSTWGALETENGSCDESCKVGYDPDCGLKVLEDSSGTISSPLYPYNYKTHAECTRTIKTPPGSRVRLEFQDIDIEDHNDECHFDFLHIYDGPDDSSPKIGTYCGKVMPPTMLASSNVLTVKFTSDYSVVKNGFFANFDATYGSMYSCAFENPDDLCGWTADTTVELLFQSIRGSTPSAGTGPSIDHTFGNAQGEYLYLETSSPAATGQRARIISPTFHPVRFDGACFSVWYNMYGTNTGSLKIYNATDGAVSSTPLHTISGDKGNANWYQLSVTIATSAPFQIAIEATRGNGYQGDIGIDDVSLDFGKCP